MSDTKGPIKTTSGIEIKSFYGQEPAPRKSEVPGEFPYTRGIHADMYRGKLWTMRQYAGFGSATEANQRFRYLLSQGTTGLSVAFDLPTQMGRDSDHALAKGEVGRVGVAISSKDDMKRLLDGIPLDKVSISMTINATAAILLALVMVEAENRGTPWNKLRGTIQNDILKEYVARGTYIFPPRSALKIVTDIFAFCSKELPEWNTISVSGYHIREAGSTAAEEIAFTLADGIAYVESAIKSGLNVDDFAPRVAFFLNCHNNFFEEVAKFRAARRLWATIMRDRFKAKNPKSLMFRFHTQTAGSSLTAQQPLNNVVRTSYQAMAAVCGGTQSLHTNSFDEALGLPTEESALLALRTQQVLASETGIPFAADPLGGSYLVESLTNELQAEAEKRIALIDSFGGMVSAIERGYPQAEIERSSYQYQQNVESGKQQIVGVNCFKSDSGPEVPIQSIDPSIEREQIERLKAFRSSRAGDKATEAINKVSEAAKEGRNMMPPIVDAVRNSATLGEISDALRQVFGEYHESPLKL